MAFRRFYKVCICLGLLAVLGVVGWGLYSVVFLNKDLVNDGVAVPNPWEEHQSPFCESEATKTVFSPLLDEEMGLDLDIIANCKEEIWLNVDLMKCDGDFDQLVETCDKHCSLALNLIGNYLDPKCAFTQDKRVLLSLAQSILEYYDNSLPLSFRTLQMWCQLQMGVKDGAKALPDWQIAACSYVVNTKDLLNQLKILRDYRSGVATIEQRTPLVDMERDLYSDAGFTYMQEVLKCLPVEVKNRRVAVAMSGCQLFTAALASLPPGQRPAQISVSDKKAEYILFAKCLKAKVPFMRDIEPYLAHKPHTLPFRAGGLDVLFYVGTNHLGYQALPLSPEVLPAYMNAKWLVSAYHSLAEGGRLVICDSYRNMSKLKLLLEMAENAGFRLEFGDNLPESDAKHPGFLALLGHDDDIFYVVLVK